jgi:hypothetical protein
MEKYVLFIDQFKVLPACVQQNTQVKFKWSGVVTLQD